MITKLKKLWMQAFGDSIESVDAFFRTAYDPTHSTAICEENEPVSALYWLDYDWNGKKLAYIYAVATEEQFQGQGYGRQLMEQAHKLLREQGYAGAVLVPAEDNLVQWYANQGYQVFFKAKKQNFFAETAIPVTQISAQQYAALRKEAKPNAPQPGKELYAYFATYGSFYEADGCIFAAARQGDKVYFQEFLGDMQKLPHIIGGLKAKTGLVCAQAEEAVFAMYYPLNEMKMPDYFSFALD